MKKIIIVEDDIFLRDELMNILEKEGYLVKSISSFNNIVEDISKENLALIILDINLPNKSGFEICKALKQKGIGPILILTSRDRLEDELHGLELGADDYLTKPCNPKRLIARVKKLMDIYSNMKKIIKIQDLKIDDETNILYYKGKDIKLTENESKILKGLIKNSPNILKKEDIFKMLWGGSDYVDENILQVNINRIRKTLGKIGLEDTIKTIRGIGYKFEIGEDHEN